MTEKSNVISLFRDAKKQKTVEVEIEEAFDDIMKKNRANLERMRRERNQDNKSTLRSYKIQTKEKK